MNRPACPEPLWIGFGLRIAQCQCGRKFKRRLHPYRSARERYRQHWLDVHELDAFGTGWPEVRGV